MPGDACPACSRPIASRSDLNLTAVWQDGSLCWRDFGGCEEEDWKKNPAAVEAVRRMQRDAIMRLRAQARRHEETIWSEYDARCAHFYKRIAQELEQHWQEETDGKE